MWVLFSVNGRVSACCQMAIQSSFFPVSFSFWFPKVQTMIQKVQVVLVWSQNAHFTPTTTTTTTKRKERGSRINQTPPCFWRGAKAFSFIFFKCVTNGDSDADLTRIQCNVCFRSLDHLKHGWLLVCRNEIIVVLYLLALLFQ